MQLVHPASLAATVDSINQALFAGVKLTAAEKTEAARFIATRQGQPGAYGELFAPLPGEPRKSLTLFTGEKITNTVAGSAHILGEEALRLLLVLKPADKEAKAAIERAAAWMSARLASEENRGRGMY